MPSGTHEAKCRCCSVFVLPAGLPGCNVCFWFFLPIFSNLGLASAKTTTELHCRALWCHEGTPQSCHFTWEVWRWNLTPALFSQKGIRVISYVADSCFSPLFSFFIKVHWQSHWCESIETKFSGLSMSRLSSCSWLSHLTDRNIQNIFLVHTLHLVTITITIREKNHRLT